MIKFEPCGADPEGGKLYRLIIDGETVRENQPVEGLKSGETEWDSHQSTARPSASI